MKVSKNDYFEDLDLGLQSIDSAKFLTLNHDLENAYIILYRSLQLIGNSYLTKNYSLRSKSKNCQFQYLYEEKKISKKQLQYIYIYI